MFAFTSSILPFLMHGDELFSDAEALFQTVRHGEGGLAKVQAVAAAAARLLSAANGALAQAAEAPPTVAGPGTVTEPPPPPPPPAPASVEAETPPSAEVADQPPL